MASRTQVTQESGAPSFASLLGNAKSLTTAVDDGFTLVERETLRDQPMVISKYTINNGTNGKWSRIWAVTADENGNPRQVKFEDGSRSGKGITATLEEMARLGVRGGVAVILRGEDYAFEDRETGATDYAIRYSFEEYAG
jgi:hypothetical protein